AAARQGPPPLTRRGRAEPHPPRATAISDARHILPGRFFPTPAYHGRGMGYAQPREAEGRSRLSEIRGDNMRRLLSPLALIVLLAGSARAESIDDVIAKNIKARGGLEKLR